VDDDLTHHGRRGFILGYCGAINGVGIRWPQAEAGSHWLAGGICEEPFYPGVPQMQSRGTTYTVRRRSGGALDHDQH